MFNGLEASKNLRTTNIKGKEYVEVNERIKAFRTVEPNGTIETELVYFENGVCVTRSVVRDAEGKIVGTGLAYEKETSSYINKTSFLENCETSSVGRALGMCGIGIDTSVASKEEVENAINNQELMQENSKGQGKRIENKKSVFMKKYDKTQEEVENWISDQGLTKPAEIEALLDKWIMK